MLHSEKLKDMNWSRRRGHLPELRRLPKDDQPPRSMPLLTQPFKAGLTGWIVIFGGVVAELARRRRRRQPDVYSDRRTGPDTSGRSGIRLRCGAVVAGTFIGSRANELVAPGRHSGWCTHLAAVADGTRAARWHDGGRWHEQWASFLLRPADNRGVRLPAPHRTGLRQPQPCLVVNGCLDSHRGATRSQVADRGMGSDSCRARWLPARYLLPQPDCSVLPPRISLASWPLIGHAVGTANRLVRLMTER